MVRRTGCRTTIVHWHVVVQPILEVHAKKGTKERTDDWGAFKIRARYGDKGKSSQSQNYNQQGTLFKMSPSTSAPASNPQDQPQSHKPAETSPSFFQSLSVNPFYDNINILDRLDRPLYVRHSDPEQCCELESVEPISSPRKNCFALRCGDRKNTLEETLDDSDSRMKRASVAPSYSERSYSSNPEPMAVEI
ncbi:hypothetical protein GX50_01817 [[Emmonsia] crescens]|uniref:Uncharacterized protein n=1 Tax=[Emmonsia] crescens TaxID=73230 RepID=A0A2B7ZQ88_9EURO|nr:hypothetical protein GX50_01817 [Emmonsia crescens]